MQELRKGCGLQSAKSYGNNKIKNVWYLPRQKSPSNASSVAEIHGRAKERSRIAFWSSERRRACVMSETIPLWRSHTGGCGTCQSQANNMIYFRRMVAGPDEYDCIWCCGPHREPTKG